TEIKPALGCSHGIRGKRLRHRYSPSMLTIGRWLRTHQSPPRATAARRTATRQCWLVSDGGFAAVGEQALDHAEQVIDIERFGHRLDGAVVCDACGALPHGRRRRRAQNHWNVRS